MTPRVERPSADAVVGALHKRLAAFERAALQTRIPYLFAIVEPGPGAIPSDSALHPVSLDPGNPATRTGGDGSGAIRLADSGGGLWGVSFNDNGLYLIWSFAQFSVSPAAPPAGSTASAALDGAFDSINGAGLSAFLASTTSVTHWFANPDQQVLFNFAEIHGAPPAVKTVDLAQNTGAPITPDYVGVFAQRYDGLGNTEF